MLMMTCSLLSGAGTMELDDERCMLKGVVKETCALAG